MAEPERPREGRCGARLRKKPGRFCQQYPVAGRKRCRLHGGHTAVGVDHPRYVHGRSVRPEYAYLTPRVYEQFSRHLEDERLLDLRPDIALLEVVKGEAARGLTVGESAAAWAEAVETLGAGVNVRTLASARQVIRGTLALMTGAHAKASAREEIGRTLERRGRLVKQYRTLLVETGDLIPAARVAVVLQQISGLVREFLKTDEERALFQRRFLGVVGPKLRSPETVVDNNGGGTQ